MTEMSDALLTAFQLTDSFLPVGSYTASYGLETYVAEGDVEDIDDVHRLLESYLAWQVGPGDMVAVRGAHEATTAEDLDELQRVDVRLHVTTLTKEFRASATASGEQLLELGLQDTDFTNAYQNRVSNGSAHAQYPVVLGMLTSQSGIDIRDTCLMYGYTFVSGLLGAAQRLLRLSHTAIQAVLDDLRSDIVTVWRENQSAPIEKMGSFAPAIEIASMHHERGERRLFMS